MMRKNHPDVPGSSPGSSSVPFSASGVRDYERTRYRGLDQKFVHRRETAICKKILERIPLPPGLVLDVPCGYGRFSELFRRRGWDMVSCDYSFAMVQRAMDSRADKVSSKRWGVVADAKQGLPFKEQTFCLLLCMRFWHHIHEDRERLVLLNHFSRVTLEWVILSYYQVNVFHLFQRRFRRIVKKSSTHITMISRADFFDEVRRAGFECVAVFPLIRGIHSQRVALLKKVRT